VRQIITDTAGHLCAHVMDTQCCKREKIKDESKGKEHETKLFETETEAERNDAN